MYVPTSHELHCWLRVALANVPRLQGRGCDSGGPPAHQWPAGQSTQTPSEALKKVPVAHDVAICMTLPTSHV